MNVLMAKSSKRNGFTVVELLITIAVIAILMAISVFTYRNVQAGADDKAREADVATIMDALERYYAKNGEYPADEDLNPTKSITRLPNFTAVKTLLPGLDDDALKGPGNYEFYAACADTVCANTSNNWRDYMTKSYWYWSRTKSNSVGGATYAKNVPATYGDKGWGCTVTTTYDDPGFVIALYSEAKKIWIFKKSSHGTVTIAPYSGGPVAPQTCAFS